MKKLILIMMVAFACFSANAQEKKNKNAKYETEVNGNCEQCKKRIEKAAFSVGGVKSAQWEIDTHKLHLILNEEKTSLAEVEKAISKAGHDAGEQKATDDAYDNLHHCCKYERK